MGFATAWLDKRALYPRLFAEAPDDQTGIIVVVPACNEPDISILLNSLVSCSQPRCKVEVLVIINAPPEADEEWILNNKVCLQNIKRWKKNNSDCFFRLLVFDAGQPSINGWGVGLARKTGMDEALRRFNSINRPDGVIVSLDADCTVAKNYFVAIYYDLLSIKERSACSVYFEHPLSGNGFPSNIFKHIIQYELHLRYYRQTLIYTGFPYPFHTVGSAIAFRAINYFKAGGMNRKKAGEDFYFIQKLVPLGGYFDLNTTTVYPLPRESDRVPFGTGPAIAKLLVEGEERLMTYNIEAFMELRMLFSSLSDIFHCDGSEVTDFYKSLPPGLGSFIDEMEWHTKITEIKSNTSGYDSFRKRFFTWFNMFRIVKYLNHTHTDIFEKQPVADQAYELLTLTGHKVKPGDPLKILMYFRSLERA